MGYISWSSFQWIFVINCSKCSKTCLTMFRLANRLLKWLQSIPKPRSGFSRHPNRLTKEWSDLLKVSSSTLAVSVIKNAHTHNVWDSYVFKNTKELSPGITVPTVQTNNDQILADLPPMQIICNTYILINGYIYILQRIISGSIGRITIFSPCKFHLTKQHIAGVRKIKRAQWHCLRRALENLSEIRSPDHTSPLGSFWTSKRLFQSIWRWG